MADPVSHLRGTSQPKFGALFPGVKELPLQIQVDVRGLLFQRRSYPFEGRKMMNCNLLGAILTGCVLMAVPAMAQQNQSQESQAIKNEKVTIPVQLETQQVMQLQQKLNKDGFAAGPVNGVWNPQTSAAIHNFQVQKGLQPTGMLDQQTISALGFKLMASNESSSGGSSSGNTSSGGSSQQSKQ
ncbi:MAG TPA: peptidoglycan-binding domain-containing protein [Acetobacteraceae bacterium]|nr:peptidoglycan-binding domain-containing protein [Acetobacteraceae bacterium]